MYYNEIYIEMIVLTLRVAEKKRAVYYIPVEVVAGAWWIWNGLQLSRQKAIESGFRLSFRVSFFMKAEYEFFVQLKCLRKDNNYV